MSIHGVEVQNIDKMERFVKENEVEIVILTMAKTRVKETAESLAKWMGEVVELLSYRFVFTRNGTS